MSISTDDVQHVARLARLSLSSEETTRMTSELSSILDHIGKISELALEGVPPTTHTLDVTNVLGDDEPHTSLPPERALSNAPDPEDDQFRVPRMQS